MGVGFTSLNEALDMTTPSGWALTGMLAVFAEFERDILRARVKASIAQAQREGRPLTVAKRTPQIRALANKGLTKSKIFRASASVAPPSVGCSPRMRARRHREGRTSARP